MKIDKGALFENGHGSCCEKHEPQRTLWLCLIKTKKKKDNLFPLTKEEDNCLLT